MTPGEPDEVRIARRMHVAQFPDRPFLRNHPRGPDASQRFTGQHNGRPCSLGCDRHARVPRSQAMARRRTVIWL
jgi:hypothetical protein